MGRSCHHQTALRASIINGCKLAKSYVEEREEKKAGIWLTAGGGGRSKLCSWAWISSVARMQPSARATSRCMAPQAADQQAVLLAMP